MILKNGSVLATPFLDVSSRLVTLTTGYDERGLLGLAFHPGFADSSSPGFRKLYTYTSEPVNGAPDFTVPNPNAFNCQSVIAEWQVSAGNPDVVDPATRVKALATDTVARAQRLSAAAVDERAARTARNLAQGLANLKRVHDAGIPVALGTDAGNPLTLHGASVFMELEAMQAAGLAPRDVLISATRTAAIASGLDSTGTVAAGSVADLVVLDADPLADVRNVRRIALVVRRGEIYTRRELEYR